MNGDDRFHIMSLSDEDDSRTIIDVFINIPNTCFYNLNVSVSEFLD